MIKIFWLLLMTMMLKIYIKVIEFDEVVIVMQFYPNILW